MRLKVDEELCTGCALCADSCPNLFEMTEDGLAKILVDEVPANEEDCARESVDNCASEAITIVE